MSTPGFGAEYSLKRSTRHYQTAPSLASFESFASYDLLTPSACPSGQTGCPNAAQCGTNLQACNRGCSLECKDKGDDSTCNADNCYSQCQQSYTTCIADGICKSLGSDANNCGSCNHVCEVANSSLTPVCTDGHCGSACNAPSVECSGTCTNVRTDSNNCGRCGAMCPSGLSCFDGCCINGQPPSLNALGGGGGNYSLFSPLGADGCQAIGGMSVSLYVTADMFAEATIGPNSNNTQCLGLSFPNEGFSIQLNAYGSSTSKMTMQYVFLVANGQIAAEIEYWPGGATTPIWVLPQTFLANTPNGSNTIPADYNLAIELGTTTDGNVVQATFFVTDNQGNTSTLPVPIFLAVPVMAFELDIGGPNNCSNAAFVTGGGVITYAAPSGLCVGGDFGVPFGCHALFAPTLETSNRTYGTMSTCCGTSMTQSLS